MLNQDKNLRITIIRGIFATIHLAFLASGLVGCVIQVHSPPEQTATPKEQSNNQPQPQPEQAIKQDKDDDHDQDDDKNHDQDDKD
ncbi:hypothetical protein [Nostoc cycadae]|uniref:Membrane protein n=1 Tax=Nostoc cycadae WK-1 TaxID=1861711 RepID=A0A2H6LLJ3_9NOSO|nr:hypothetical protein [Nostoc cycadae]GBE94089.1 membrane protein [Nostoc cycadae WK-1]